MNRRERRAAGNRGRVIDAEPVKLVVDHARLLGCTCVPDVQFSGPVHYGEISPISLRHESWCPLISGGDLRSAMLVVRPADIGDAA
jgi:hypothetical protein